LSGRAALPLASIVAAAHQPPKQRGALGALGALGVVGALYHYFPLNDSRANRIWQLEFGSERDDARLAGFTRDPRV
jgi:hypothetical protein